MAVRRRILQILVAGLMLVGMFPASASATHDSYDIINGYCGSNELCLYRHYNFTGSIADFNWCEPAWSCGVHNFSLYDYYHTSMSPDDRTSSVYNQVTSLPWANIAQHDWGGGMKVCYQSGALVGSLAPQNMNDRPSSYWTSNYSGC